MYRCVQEGWVCTERCTSGARVSRVWAVFEESRVIVRVYNTVPSPSIQTTAIFTER